MTGPDRATSNGTESVEKKFSAVFPRNPLISPDSDERIQGNPRKSNPQKPGFSQRNGEEPENPNGSAGPTPREVKFTHLHTVITLKSRTARGGRRRADCRLKARDSEAMAEKPLRSATSAIGRLVLSTRRLAAFRRSATKYAPARRRRSLRTASQGLASRRRRGARWRRSSKVGRYASP